jgi:uncharacterized protein with von Willebrand factor type A (vWA) domain
MTRWHRSSDYGSMFADFVDRYLDAVGPRSTVLILGDARTNNTEPRLDALAEIVARAKRVDWLNPEPPSQWGAGDSVAHLYGQICRHARVRERRPVAAVRDAPHARVIRPDPTAETPSTP